MISARDYLHRAAICVTFLVALIYSPPADAKPKFIGNLVCKDCHKEVYASWETSLHAKVFDLLPKGVRAKQKLEAGLKPDVNYQQDQSCMDCHVTGLNEGGYDFTAPKKEWEGIGCEECHGPAEKWMAIHDKEGIKKKERKLKQAGLKKPFSGKTVCLRCHGNRNSPYKYRAQNLDRDWTSMEWAKTYHILPEPPRR